MTPTERMTTSEVAELLGVSVATVNRRANAGELPYEFKAPGARGAFVFNRRIVEMYAKAQAVKAS